MFLKKRENITLFKKINISKKNVIVCDMKFSIILFYIDEHGIKKKLQRLPKKNYNLHVCHGKKST